jgi:hypothetical protein
MNKAIIVVLFYDENQILNDDEAGTMDTFLNEVGQKNISTFSLQPLFRISEAIVYNKFINII